MKTPIGITAIASVSSLGMHAKQVEDGYRQGKVSAAERAHLGEPTTVFPLGPESEEALEALRSSQPNYRQLDRSVLMGILASRKLVEQSGRLPSGTGVNLGSSRGATDTFEKRHSEFIDKGRTAVLTSPTTTLGNLSSWVAQDLGCQGPAMSHSVTCSTALHALLNGIAWIGSGISPAFLVGGSEAPLTDFTLAQMKALRIYSGRKTGVSPCASLDLEKTDNTMVLGEAAAIALIEPGVNERTLAVITGYGFASETLAHPTSLSTEGNCFKDAMKMALKASGRTSVDAIVMHAPGTVLGDMAELNAIDATFQRRPLLTSNKWMCGHTLGASGMLSLDMGVNMLRTGEFIPNPFYTQQGENQTVNSVLVNAVGFGGNAVSILIEAPK